MKTKRFDDSASEERTAIFKLDDTHVGSYYWAKLVTVCEAKTGRSWRVTVYGRQVEGRVTRPLIQRAWICKEDGLTPAGAAKTALHMARKVKVHTYGLRIVDQWRKSGVAQAVAKGVQRRIDAAFGQGWIYTSMPAQIEAYCWLRKAKVVGRLE